MISLTSSIRFLGDRIEQIESCYQGCRLKGCRVSQYDEYLEVPCECRACEGVGEVKNSSEECLEYCESKNCSDSTFLKETHLCACYKCK